MQKFKTPSHGAALGAAMAMACIPLHAGAQIGSTALEEVVVTASRREESIQDSSLIIEALSGEQIYKDGITSVADIGRIMPSVQVGNAGPALQVYIRGVGNPGSTAVTNPAVAINKDGVYIARSQAAGASFYDLQRIEVLKGPQGTLYGRNATGGAVNLITTAPALDETAGYAAVDVGNYDLIQFEGAANVPLSEQLAARASVFAVDRDGYLSDDTSDDEHWSGRLQGLWEPNEKVSLQLQGQYAKCEGKGQGFSYAGADSAWDSIYPGGNTIISDSLAEDGLIAPSFIFPWLTGPIVDSNPAFDLIALVNPIEDDTTQDMEFWDVSATLSWEMDFATLTVIPAYQKAEMYYVIHPGLRYETGDPLAFDTPEKSEASSLEVRLSDDGERLKWVVGVNLYNETQDANVYVYQGAVQNVAILSELKTESLGVFGESVYNLTDTWRLIAGLRYSDDQIDKEDFSRWALNESVDCDPAGPDAQLINGIVTCPISQSLDQNASFDNVSWKAGVEYDLSADNMLFLTVSTGYKSGGLQSVSGPAYDPEELIAYELGTRNLFLDGRLKINGDLFYWDYSDHQEFKIGPDELGIIGQSIVNAGDATMKGGSVDIQFAATESDLLRFSAEYLDTEYDEFNYTQASTFTAPTVVCPVSETGELVPVPGPVPLAPELLIDCAGFEMTRAPKWTSSAGYTHSFALGDAGTLDANVTMTYTDKTWLSANFLEQQRADAYTLWNASVTYYPQNDKFSATAYVNNIDDEESYGSSTAHSNVYQLVGLSPNAPRTYGVRLRYNF